MHELLIYCLGGLSQPRKRVVRLNDRPDISVYFGCKTIIQQQLVSNLKKFGILICHWCVEAVAFTVVCLYIFQLDV